MTSPEIVPMVPADYDAALALWQTTPGICVDPQADSRAAIGAYLARNPQLSSVARLEGRVVGTLLAGHDGRRGFLHHLAVAPDCRRRGLGSALVARSLAELRAAGMARCHLFLVADNAAGRAFWESLGWRLRQDVQLFTLAPCGAGGACQCPPR
jgi:ribosomal protein S18 acetylase RimI-like enzyme